MNQPTEDIKELGRTIAALRERISALAALIDGKAGV
jgi:hypothetical protein